MTRNKLRAIRQAIIPPILLVILPTTLMGFLASGSREPLLLLAALLFATLADISANIINNYFDWDIDARNNKRALMHRHLSKKELLGLYAITLIFLAMMLAYLKANYLLATVIVIFVVLGAFYSAFLKLKDKFILNYVTIAIAYAGLAFLIGFFGGSPSIATLSEYYPLIIFLILMDFGYAMTKDYSDVDGDMAFEKKTLPVVYGKRNAIRLQAVIISLTYLLLALSIHFGLLEKMFFILFVSYLVAMYKLVRIRDTADKNVHSAMHSLAQINGLIARFIIIALVFLL